VRWNILGGHLELYGKGGELLARFEERTSNDTPREVFYER